MEIKTGKQFKLVRTVTEEMTAASVGSSDLRVLATPVMIALFEESSAACLREFLDPEQTSVGVSVDVRHTSATPVGGTVRVNTEIVESDGRTVTFRATASDDSGEIGDCIHRRVIVAAERFLEKAYAKLK